LRNNHYSANRHRKLLTGFLLLAGLLIVAVLYWPGQQQDGAAPASLETVRSAKPYRVVPAHSSAAAIPEGLAEQLERVHLPSVESVSGEEGDET